MAKTLQFRRDTTVNLASVTGAAGEIFIDTTKDTVVVMDGSTAGGTPLALESAIPTNTNQLTNGAGFLTSSDISGKQATLVSGTNIKTINGTSILGSGDITIEGSAPATQTITLDGYTNTYTDGVSYIGFSAMTTEQLALLDALVTGDSVTFTGLATPTDTYVRTVTSIENAEPSFQRKLFFSGGNLVNTNTSGMESALTAIEIPVDPLAGKQDTLVSGTSIKTVNGISLLDVTQGDPGSDINLQTAFVNATTVSIYFYYGPGTIAPNATAFYESNPAAFTLTDTSASTLYTGGTYSEPYLDGPGYTRIDVTGFTSSAGAHALTGGGYVLSSPSTPANTNIAIDTLPSLTIGDVYYETNIVSPIPVITTTSYGTFTNIPPLVINGPLSVLSDSTTATTFATLAGDNLSGSQSGGVNNFGAISGGSYLSGARGRVNFTILKPTDATITFFKNLRSGDILTGIGTNGIFTGSFEMTIDTIQYGPRLDNGSVYVDIGEHGFVQLWGELTDINNAPDGTNQGINANIFTAARPYTTSTVNGGLSPTFLDTQQVVSEEIVVNKKLNVIQGAYLGATYNRSSGVYNQYATGFGGPIVPVDVRTKNFIHIDVTGSNAYAVQLNWTVLDPQSEAYERTVTVMITAQSTTPLTVAYGGANTTVNSIDPLGSYSTNYSVPTYWKDSSYPTEVVAGRTLEMKFKFVAGGLAGFGGFNGLYCEWKEYY